MTAFSSSPLPAIPTPNTDEDSHKENEGSLSFWLSSAYAATQDGRSPMRTSVRTLLGWFGAQRRGSFIVDLIRHELAAYGLRTEPDFNSVWIDAEVDLLPANNAEPTEGVEERNGGVEVRQSTTLNEAAEASQDIYVGGVVEDPTYRIGRLEAANRGITFINPSASIDHAVTLMLIHGFSQIPVAQSERDIKGIVTLESVGARLASKRDQPTLLECRLPAQIIDADRSLFAAIEIIAQHQYVLVQGADRKISGIVTAYDLNRQFQQLTEPFLLLGEVEQHIRKLIAGKFRAEDLREACDPRDTREIASVADLTMGEYIRLLENPERWDQLRVAVDRKVFIENLQVVRRIRNDIMHFDPDPLGAADLLSLRRFVLFMQNLRELGVF